MLIATATRAELEFAIIENDDLLARFDWARLATPGGYSDDELRETISAWIADGDECGA